MKKILIITTLALFIFSSCEDTSLEGKKKALSKLKTEINERQEKADKLKAEINELEGVKEIKKHNVTALTVEEKPFAAFVEVQGTSQAENSVNIMTDIGGLVKAVYVDEGQYVHKGKTLIKLDNSIVASQLAELNTSIELAKDVYEKRDRLWKKNIGSEIEYLQAKNQYNALLKKKNTLNTTLAKATIKAPISGTVDMVYLKVGELASPGYPAVNVVNLKNMEVQVSVPETYLGKIKKGDKVDVFFPSINKNVEAKIKSVSQSINRNNRTFTAVASLPNKDKMLKPNLLAKIKIKSDSKGKAITIPTNLLQKSAQGFYVYVIAENEGKTIAKEIPVEIGESYNGQIIITKGLKANDKLINEGYRDVLDGDLIEIVSE